MTTLDLFSWVPPQIMGDRDGIPLRQRMSGKRKVSRRATYCKQPEACLAKTTSRCPCMSKPTQKKLHPNEYYAWTNMKTRCSNPNYSEFHRYGERGLTVYPEWQQSFEAFLAHVGPKPFPEAMLDRLDNSKGYEPGNIKWSTPLESCRNRDVVKPVEAFGYNLLLPEWEQASGRCRKIIWRRLKQGWSAEMAIAAPPMPYKYRTKSDPVKAYEADWKPSHTVERMSCGKGLFAYRLIPNVKA